MSDAVDRFLRSVTDEFSMGEQLHDVPPHVVHGVTFEGRRAVCKVSTEPRGHAGIEGRVQRHVGRETAVPVPEVLAVDGDPDDPATGLRVDAPPGATWSDALDALLGVYEDAVRGTDYATAVADARWFVEEHADRFDEGGEAVLLHGWFTPEHVAVRDGEARCVIDFEHTLVGSPAWDYWRTAVPLFLADGWDGPDDAAATFRDAYESVRPLPTDVEADRDAYVALVTASYLDSLVTQRGIDATTREQAAAIESQLYDSLEAARESFET